MSVVFQADARPEAGGGHMRRCINLARALRTRCDVAFVLSADAAPLWRARLDHEGIACVNETTVLNAGAAVLDGYDLRQADVTRWKRKVSTLVLIEDLRRHFSGVDLYVASGGPPPLATRVLAGPRYALLDVVYGRPVEPRLGSSMRILVACGLRDSAGLTLIYLDALSRCAVPGRAITVVIGRDAPHCEVVERRASDLGAEVVVEARDMVVLYNQADLVLGAGGVSLFERMARGRASATAVVADNQAHSAKQMAACGGTLLLGNARDLTEVAVAEAIGRLLADAAARAEMAARARRTVDGKGAERTAEEIISLAGKVMQNASAARRDGLPQTTART